MRGTLYYDDIEKVWYVNWMNIPELYPSVALSGRLKLYPDDVGSGDIKSGEEVEYSPVDGYAKLIEPVTTYNPTLYSKIETEIIRWSNDGTKTAGELTRKIIELIKN